MGGGDSKSERTPGNSEDITVPDNPNNDNPTPEPSPEPTPTPPQDSSDVTPVPDDPVNNADTWPDVNGTWKVETASFEDVGYNTVNPFSRSIPQLFDIEVKDIENYYSSRRVLRNVLVFVGDDFEGSGEPYSVVKVLFRHVTRINGEEIEFESMQTIFAGYREDFKYVGNNTYEYLHSAIDEEHAGSSYTISFPDEDTIIIVYISKYYTDSKMEVTLKRIN